MVCEKVTNWTDFYW